LTLGNLIETVYGVCGIAEREESSGSPLMPTSLCSENNKVLLILVEERSSYEDGL